MARFFFWNSIIDLIDSIDIVIVNINIQLIRYIKLIRRLQDLSYRSRDILLNYKRASFTRSVFYSNFFYSATRDLI